METKSQDNQLELDQSAIHLLHRAGQCAGDLFSEEVVNGGLTARQFAVLMAVSQEEGLSQTDLVERTGIDRSTLADIIRRVLKKGLVSRRRTKKDARVYSVRLTDAGRKALRAAMPAANQAESRLLSALDPVQRDNFLDSLSVIVRTVGAGNGKDGA